MFTSCFLPIAESRHAPPPHTHHGTQRYVHVQYEIKFVDFIGANRAGSGLQLAAVYRTIKISYAISLYMHDHNYFCKHRTIKNHILSIVGMSSINKTTAQLFSFIVGLYMYNYN